MKTPTITVKCQICGCDGELTITKLGGYYLDNTFVSHKNPRICEENLKRKNQVKQEIEKL